MGCKIIYKGVSYDESEFKNQINRYIAINQLLETDSNLANQVYEALGFGTEKVSKFPILNKQLAINTLKERVKELEKELLLTFEGKGKRSEFWINEDIRTWEKIIKTLENNDNINVTNVFNNQNVGKDLSDKKGVEVFELETDNVLKVGVLFEKTVDVINAGKKVNSSRIHPFTEFHWYKNEFAAVATKAKGVPLKRGEKLTLTDIEKKNLYSDLAQIENAGLTIDISKHNNFYYSKGEGIHFIDLGAETVTANEKNNNFFLDNFFENTSSVEYRKFKESFKPTTQITPQQKQQASSIYSQYLESLNKPNTNPILQDNQEEQIKKFAELQERLNNKEFLEGAKGAYESTPTLQQYGTQEEYNDYIARVSLGIIKNPSSGKYNYTSKVKDIVYHGTGKKDWKPFKGKNFFTDKQNAENYANVIASEDFEFTGKLTDTKVIPVIINTNPEIVSKDLSIEEIDNYKTTKDGIIANVKEPIGLQKQYVVFEPEQIHILSSKADIEGFKEFVNAINLNSDLINDATELILDPSEYPEQDQRDSQESPTVKYYKELLDKLSKKFNIKWVEDNEMDEIGRFESGVVKINFSKIKPDTVFHEFAHPFVELIKVKNPVLYKALANRARSYKVDGVRLEDKLLQDGYSQEDLDSEAITTVLGLKGSQLNSIEGSIIKDRIKAFINKIVELIKELFPNNTLEVDKLSTNTSFSELAYMLFNTDVKVDYSDMNFADQIFFQRSQDVFNVLKKLKQDIKLDQASHTYTVNGKPTDGSVHSKFIEPFYRNKYGDNKFSDAQIFINNLLKQYGTGIHEDIESIAERYIDPDTGLLRDKVLPVTKLPVTNKLTYDTLEDYLKDLFELYKKQYGKDVRYSFEQRLYNPSLNIAGTADLVIILPDGKMHVKDWKSMQRRDKNGKVIENINTVKATAFDIQLSNYKTMLEMNTGTEVSSAMAIPIELNIVTTYDFDFNQFTKAVSGKIAIGNADPTVIPDELSYLTPHVLTAEKSKDESLNNLINIFEDLLDKAKKLSTKDNERKYEKVDKLLSIIKDLKVRNKITGLLKNANILLTNAYYASNNDNITIEQLNELIFELSSYDRINTYIDNSNLAQNITKEDRDKLSKLQGDSAKLRNILENKRLNIIQTISNEFGVSDIKKTEKKIDFMKGLFRSLSQINNRTFKVFYNLLVRAQDKRDNKIRQDLEKMKELTNNLSKWASSKGMSMMDAFKKMVQLDEDGKPTPRFINHYTKEFYKEKEKAIKEGNTKWLYDNMVFDADKYEEELKKTIDFWQNAPYLFGETKDEHDKIVENKIKQFKEKHDIRLVKTSILAFSNSSNRFIKPIDKHESAEWKYLQQNKPLKDMYDEFMKINKNAHKMGMIKNINFIPSIRASKIEQLAIGDGAGAFKMSQWLEDIKVKNEIGFGAVNKITGASEYKVPVYYTEFMGEVVKENPDGTKKYDFSKQSFDLSKVFATWMSHTYDFEMKQSLEPVSVALVEIEKNKKVIDTNRYGKINKGKTPGLNSTPEEVVSDANYKYLKEFVDYYIYDQAQFSQYDKSIKGYSLLKLAKLAQAWMSNKTLGLNVTSAASNLFGGTVNGYLQAVKGNMFTQSDWMGSVTDLTMNSDIASAFIELIDPLMDNRTNIKINNLSVSNAKKIFNTDHLYSMMRGTDKMVQFPVAISILKNYMIDDNGELVKISDFARNEIGYANSLNLSASELKEKDELLKKKIEELKENKSIYKTAKVSNDKLDTKLTEEHVAELRRIIRKVNKNILGNTSSDDVYLAKLNLLGSFAMQFRSWMPQLITERFGDANVDSDLDTLTYGKTRNFVWHMLSTNALTLTKELIFGFGDATLDRMKEKYQDLKKRHEESGGEDFVSFEEFREMYIGNLKSQLRELQIILSMTGLLLSLAGIPPEDRDKVGIYKVAMRALHKFDNELTFFYNPQSATELINKPFPVVTLLTDALSLIKHSFGEGFYYVAGDEEDIENTRPMKYAFKLLPILKEGADWYSALNDDFRKEHDIKIIYR